MVLNSSGACSILNRNAFYCTALFDAPWSGKRFIDSARLYRRFHSIGINPRILRIFGQNPSARWSPSFVFSEEEKSRLSVARRQALCPRLPLGTPIRGKWAAPHEENSPAAITAIAATKHLIETMRDALEADEMARRRNEGDEEEESVVHMSGPQEIGDDASVNTYLHSATRISL